MIRKMIFVIVFLMVIISIANGQQLNIRINAPRDKAIVSERSYAEGIVSDSNVKVWVIVHPMEVSDYWVQPRVTVKETGFWKVKINTGMPGDAGRQFKIMAVANPKDNLKEGDVLRGWPKAQAKSQVIEVIRKFGFNNEMQPSRKRLHGGF
ncbi:MAG: hypothetical protein KGQ83_00735 [Planctomycetes bacterium]|nr:hypothetical protein [Planctomycetota bacterium]